MVPIMKFLLLHFGLGLVLLITGCSFGGKSEKVTSSHPAIIDPADALVREALLLYFTAASEPISSTYRMVRHDLNKDGRRDALVYIKAPFSHWCSFQGCPMLVLKARNDGFNVISKIAPVRGPITIAPSQTNGWDNLIIRVSGRSDQRLKDVLLRYDGASYPSNPEALPEYALSERHVGRRIFE